jgi:response regulator RpfG family c-di-GMP phosphodiesterase
MEASGGSHFDPVLIDIFLKANAQFAALYEDLSGSQPQA